MLGPGPVDTSNVPSHMLVSSQKLLPGSGCLTVRTTMDGPVRVVQINDINQRVGALCRLKPLKFCFALCKKLICYHSQVLLILILLYRNNNVIFDMTSF